MQTGNLSQVGEDELRRELFDYYQWTDYIGRQTATYQEVARELERAAYQDFQFQPFESTTRRRGYEYPIVAVEPVAEIPRNPVLIGTLGNFGRRISQLRPLLLETRERNLALQQRIEDYLQNQDE